MLLLSLHHPYCKSTNANQVQRRTQPSTWCACLAVCAVGLCIATLLVGREILETLVGGEHHRDEEASTTTVLEVCGTPAWHANVSAALSADARMAPPLFDGVGGVRECERRLGEAEELDPGLKAPPPGFHA